MKLILPTVALLAIASTAQAQEPTRITSEPTPVAAPAPARWTSKPALEPVATPTATPAPEAGATATTTVRSMAPRETAAASSVVAARAQPANFWWLVGAIVLGGVILAVLL